MQIDVCDVDEVDVGDVMQMKLIAVHVDDVDDEYEYDVDD